MTNRAALFAFGLVASIAMTIPAMAQDNAGTTLRTIPLSGFGVVEAKPEFASVKITVPSQAETVDKVLAANKEATDKARARIALLSLPQTDVRIGETVIYQGYSSKKSVISSALEKAFDADTTIEVVVRDLPNSSRVLAALFALEDVRVHSLTWNVSDTTPLLDKARTAAIKDARRRADLYVQAAGAKIGRILTIEESARQDIAMESREERYEKKTSNQTLTPPLAISFRAGVNTVWSIE